VDVALRDRWLQLAHQRVADAGLRSGAARSQVIELLAREGQCLLGAQQIVDRLRATGSAGSQASVYRVLEELHGLGLVHRSIDDQGIARYEIADPEGHHHHHFVDDETGAVEPFEDVALEDAIREAARRRGIALSGHEIVLKGTRVREGQPT
jgi:Fur family ferric uptake transcriptional regulator